MALQLPNASAFLSRNGGYLNPGASWLRVIRFTRLTSTPIPDFITIWDVGPTDFSAAALWLGYADPTSGTGGIEFQAQDASGPPSNQGIFSDVIPPVGLPISLAVRYNGSTHLFDLFVNSTKVSGGATLNMSAVPPQASEVIGNTTGADSVPFAVDYEGVWQGDFTDDQVFAQMQDFSPVPLTPNPLRWTPLTSTTDIGDWTLNGGVTNIVVQGPIFQHGNVTPATAYVIPSLPALLAGNPIGVPDSALSLLPDCTGVENPSWFVYTPKSCERVLSLLVFDQHSGGSGVSIGVSVWLNPPNNNSFGCATGALPLQVAVTPGQPVYIQVSWSTGVKPTSMPFTLSVQAAADPGVTAGSLMIPSDIFTSSTPNPAGYPAAVFNGTTGSFSSLPNIAQCEVGDSLPDGTVALQDERGSALTVYNPKLVVVATLSALYGPSSPGFPIRGDKVSKFYVAVNSPGLVGPTIIKTINNVGTIGGTTWSLPYQADGVTAIAVDATAKILYYVYANQAIIYRYDLNASMPLSNLATAPVHTNGDIMVLADGTVLIIASTTTWNIYHYSAAGALLNTYSQATLGITGRILHITWALDDPNSFWVWAELDGTPLVTPNTMFAVINVKVSDGSILHTFSARAFDHDVGLASSPPLGPTGSCPLIMMPQTVAPFICFSLNCSTHQATILGDFSAGIPTITIVDPSSNPVQFSVVSSSSTQCVIALPAFTANGVYTITVNGSTFTQTLSCSVGWGSGSIGGVGGGGTPLLNGTFHAIRRVRRFPLPYEGNIEQFIGWLEFALQVGQGLPSGQGSDPQLMLRVSKDGGITWGPERWVSVGQQGQYDVRAVFRNLGRGRNWVIEISMTDPVFWAFQGCFAEIEKGTS